MRRTRDTKLVVAVAKREGRCVIDCDVICLENKILFDEECVWALVCVET